MSGGEGQIEKEREREKREKERERERERKNLKQAPCSVQSPMLGFIPQPWDHDLSQNQASEAQPTELLRRPYS